MARLSFAVFEWDGGDVARLREAKQSQEGLGDAAYVKLSAKELARHSRRRTRGAAETERLLREVLDAFWEVTDSMGVPLIDRARMEEIWSTQRRHLGCIQDPAGVELYAQTGELTKGGVRLPVYRCARDSTSLESFHLHLCRFIPGTSASDIHFQVYLLEGLVRWNENRGRELIGVEYLYSQTGAVLQQDLGDPDAPDGTDEGRGTTTVETNQFTRGEEMAWHGPEEKGKPWCVEPSEEMEEGGGGGGRRRPQKEGQEGPQTIHVLPLWPAASEGLRTQPVWGRTLLPRQKAYGHSQCGGEHFSHARRPTGTASVGENTSATPEGLRTQPVWGRTLQPRQKAYGHSQCGGEHFSHARRPTDTASVGENTSVPSMLASP
ncbi:hypothetical protein ACEWY4_021958 [Coilia grayii]|uniref:Uncharacterized protein n=1 Tax=Coilia grayii TaxID=363190 RepID=A0ABD1J759_9TELE